MPAYNLESDRKAARRKSTGHCDRRVSDGRNVICRSHPVDVGLHFHAGNLGGIVRLHVERKNLIDGKDEILVFFEELLYPLIESRALGLRSRKIRPVQFPPFSPI